MRSITQVLRQQARSISATAQRLQLLGDDWGVPPSDDSNAACASESRAVRQKRYEEVSQATPNGRLAELALVVPVAPAECNMAVFVTK